jgi:hypothetical protein
MKTLKCTITGLRPLIMHNGMLADPTNPHVVAIKAITSKGSKKMTVADFQERDNLEWRGGLYWSEEARGLVIPSDNIEACICAGARKERKGKDALAAVFCQEDEIVIDHPMKGKSLEKIMENPEYTLRKGVRVQQARIIRIRPRVPQWSATFNLEFDETVMNERDLKAAVMNAGALVGLGDWRPKYGRFTVEF